MIPEPSGTMGKGTRKARGGNPLSRRGPKVVPPSFVFAAWNGLPVTALKPDEEFGFLRIDPLHEQPELRAGSPFPPTAHRSIEPGVEALGRFLRGIDTERPSAVECHVLQRKLDPFHRNQQRFFRFSRRNRRRKPRQEREDQCDDLSNGRCSPLFGIHDDL
ncbi:MAG: hypothetical protein ACYTHN_00985 [Planctomycetota bacterium]|jgi:hypothetical protein